MKRFKNATIFNIMLGGFLLLALLSGCGGTQEDVLTAEEVLSSAHTAMSGMEGFHFLISTEGKDAFLDQAQTIVLKQAEGDFLSPDRVAADIKVTFSGMILQVSIINIAESKWETNPLTGAWQESTSAYAFQPLELLDPDNGIIAVIAEDTTELVMETGATLEELPGQELIVLTGTLNGARISQLSYGLIDDEMLGITLWITPDTYEVNKLVITDPLNEGEDVDTLWTMEFWSFGVSADIQPPL